MMRESRPTFTSASMLKLKSGRQKAV